MIPAAYPAAFEAARMMADLHGKPAPDERALAEYGEVLLRDVRDALAGTMRRIAAGQHDVGVLPAAPVPRDAAARAWLKAADLVETVLEPAPGQDAPRSLTCGAADPATGSVCELGPHPGCREHYGPDARNRRSAWQPPSGVAS